MNYQKWVVFVAVAVLTPAALAYTDKELECFEKEKVYHSESGQCYRLLTKGPCPSKQWFVLDKPTAEGDSRTTGVCKPDVCPDGQFYWPSTRKCVTGSDEVKLCGRSNSKELRYNLNGEGQCLCRRDPPHERPKGVPDQCYKLYTQGPCASKQIFAFPDPDADFPICQADPCYKNKLEIQLSGKVRHVPLLAKYNGTCYELEKRGPCEDLHIFKVILNTRVPTCRALINQIWVTNKPRCDLDLNQQCAVTVHKTKRNKGKIFLTDLLRD